MSEEHAEVREASADELPRILVSPPWLSRTPPPALPQIEGLTPGDVAPRIQFSDAECMQYADPTPDLKSLREYNLLPRTLKPRTPEMDAHVLARIAKRNPIRFGVAHLALMTEEAAAKTLETVDLHQLLPDHYDLRHLLVRYKHRALARFLEVAPLDPELAAYALGPVESTRAGALMGQLYAKSARTLRAVIEAYFKRFPVVSALGILPLALAKKTQKTMVKTLQAFKGLVGREPIDTAAARFGPEVVGAVDALLAYAGPPRPTPVLPSWYVPEDLPPLWLFGEKIRLGSVAVRHFGTLLALTDLDQPDPAIDEVKAVLTADSLARFAWGLFLRWVSNGANAKEDWAMLAMGRIGDDTCAKSLTPMIRAWPGESAHARAVKGLDVLAGIGSDMALMHLDAIAEKVKFKALQERARQKIEQVAEKRGLTREELADRIAPTLELDADGSRVLSFGSRSFRVGFDEQLLPFVADESGKKGDLPKPRATDDASSAKDSIETRKTLKKDARAVATVQIARLERAMCSSRRWSASDFRNLLVSHPLVFHLTKRLLWGIYDGPNFARGFRVAEDRSFADVDDTPVDLASATVGLVHRLDIDDETSRRWVQVFSDYGIVQPFSQIAREVSRPNEAEAIARSIDRFAGLEVASNKLLTLESRGWRKTSVS